VAAAGTWEQRFRRAAEAVRNGRFDDVKAALEALGFEFRETKDPNHWMYFTIGLERIFSSDIRGTFIVRTVRGVARAAFQGMTKVKQSR
jgi:hypothetical protein